MFLAEVASQTVGLSDFESILTALQNQISVANIVAILATLAGVSVAFAFMWWGVRKLIKVIMSAFKKGKVSL